MKGKRSDWKSTANSLGRELGTMGREREVGLIARQPRFGNSALLRPVDVRTGWIQRCWQLEKSPSYWNEARKRERRREGEIGVREGGRRGEKGRDRDTRRERI